MPVPKADREISVQEVQVKFGPLIDMVKAEGDKNVATISFGALMRAGALMQRQLDEWSGKKKKARRLKKRQSNPRERF